MAVGDAGGEGRRRTRAPTHGTRDMRSRRPHLSSHPPRGYLDRTTSKTLLPRGLLGYVVVVIVVVVVVARCNVVCRCRFPCLLEGADYKRSFLLIHVS